MRSLSRLSRRQRRTLKAFSDTDDLDDGLVYSITPHGQAWLAERQERWAWLEELLAHAKANGSRMCELWEGYPR